MPNENKHSVLAPSSKEWVHCGYSAKFLAIKEEETNDASEFGTECHALAEAYIKYVCEKYRKSNIEEFGFGKGYVYLQDEFSKLLTALDKLIELLIQVVM